MECIHYNTGCGNRFTFMLTEKFKDFTFFGKQEVGRNTSQSHSLGIYHFTHTQTKSRLLVTISTRCLAPQTTPQRKKVFFS